MSKQLQEAQLAVTLVAQLAVETTLAVVTMVVASTWGKLKKGGVLRGTPFF